MSDAEAPKVFKTSKEYLELLIQYTKEADVLAESIKAVKDEIKEAGMDHVSMATVATAIARGKEDKLQEKSETILEIISEYVE